MRFRTLLLLLLSLASSALAQTHFCIAGDLDRLSATQISACRASMTDMREAVRRRGAPAGWHFVVVCDETGWTDYARMIAPLAGASLENADFHTESSLHWTFVRRSRMGAGGSEEAERLLEVALQSVPGFRPVPRNLPAPRRVLREPSLAIARVEAPQLP